jgi:hypothetical protein
MEQETPGSDQEITIKGYLEDLIVSIASAADDSLNSEAHKQ